jgi:hypothetical protein
MNDERKKRQTRSMKKREVSNYGERIIMNMKKSVKKEFVLNCQKK